MTKARRALIYATERGYRVTNDGRVIGPSGRERALSKGTNGRLHFNIRWPFGEKKRETATIYVHRLAAYQMFGERLFRDDLEVCHLDNNPLNNAKSNLILGTRRTNMSHRTPETLKRVLNAASQGRRALSDEQVAALREERRQGATYKALMAKYGIAKSTLWGILNGKWEVYQESANDQPHPR